jgi:4-hydroxy-tetrahydrodipicolinate synthase
MVTGAFTALVTPFSGDGIDEEGLERLTAFQAENGITGVLAVGTTGESPALSWREHNAVVEAVARHARGKCQCVAGTGSNNTREALEGTRHAAEAGADAVLLVDPYYNGPSSLEIRREYIGPVARAFPDVEIISYVIPGRTGTQLLPEDLARLSAEFPNVRTVKEATANLDNMRRTRELCGADFSILSGDDGLTLPMMTDPKIAASGVISVASNIAPRAVSEMVRLLAAGEVAESEKLQKALEPLFGILMVKTQEKTPHGDVLFRARNPLPTKTLMAILGMPAGPCRQPLGRLTPQAMEVVLGAARRIWTESPEILAPAAAFFDIDVDKRLNDPACWRPFVYDETY